MDTLPPVPLSTGLGNPPQNSGGRRGKELEMEIKKEEIGKEISPGIQKIKKIFERGEKEQNLVTKNERKESKVT